MGKGRMDLSPLFREGIRVALEHRFLCAAKEYFEYISRDMFRKYEDSLRKENRLYRLPCFFVYQNEHMRKELDKIYRQLALKYHPDKNPDGATTFLEITRLYEKRDLVRLRQLLHGVPLAPSVILHLGPEQVELTTETISGLVQGPVYRAYKGLSTYGHDDCYNREELLCQLQSELKYQQMRENADPELIAQIERFIAKPELCRYL